MAAPSSRALWKGTTSTSSPSAANSPSSAATCRTTESAAGSAPIFISAPKAAVAAARVSAAPKVARQNPCNTFMFVSFKKRQPRCRKGGPCSTRAEDRLRPPPAEARRNKPMVCSGSASRDLGPLLAPLSAPRRSAPAARGTRSHSPHKCYARSRCAACRLPGGGGSSLQARYARASGG